MRDTQETERVSQLCDDVSDQLYLEHLTGTDPVEREARIFTSRWEQLAFSLLFTWEDRVESDRISRVRKAQKTERILTEWHFFTRIVLWQNRVACTLLGHRCLAIKAKGHVYQLYLATAWAGFAHRLLSRSTLSRIRLRKKHWLQYWWRRRTTAIGARSISKREALSNFNRQFYN